MKRFLLFAWNSDEKSGGWNDFEDSFDPGSSRANPVLQGREDVKRIQAREES